MAAEGRGSRYLIKQRVKTPDEATALQEYAIYAKFMRRHAP
jgi:hypothetical protein